MWWRGAGPGLVAGVVGLIGWIYALFGQTGRYETAGTVVDRSTGTVTVMPVESGTTSMWASQDFHLITVLFLLVMLASITGVLVGAVMHGRYGDSAGRGLMWVSSVVLFLGAVLSMFSIGIYLMPGAVLSGIAAALAFVSVGRGNTPVAESG